MPYQITKRDATAGGRPGTVYTLASGDNATAIEVWPAVGFNCLRWRVKAGDLFYVAPDWDANPVPTRSGHPVLFPFPNRLRGGKLSHAGKDYQLALTDSTKKHAIHGFTPRLPWRVVHSGFGDSMAWITGEFRVPQDAPQAVWPGDLSVNVTYTLTAAKLRVDATVRNHGRDPVPFGLGYHPYFRHPLLGEDETADDLVVMAAAAAYWPAADNFPTGEKLPVSAALDFRDPKPLGGAVLDLLYGDVGGPPTAWVGHKAEKGRVVITADPGFRELLLFTPPHRHAVAVEPYTCATDAAHLADAGWQTLAGGDTSRRTVEYAWEPNWAG